MGLLSGLFFLALLAACSLAGTTEQARVQPVSLPLERTALTQEESAQLGRRGTRERLAQERQQTMDMLDNVIANDQTAAQTKQNALAQKTEMAKNMESEARTEAALAFMGYDDASVILGGGNAAVFVSSHAALNESDRMRIIDAACGLTGLSADRVKIILAKK